MADRYQHTTGRRFERDGRDAVAGGAGSRTMTSRTEHVERLHALIAENAYEVDPDAVAQAILRRLLGPGEPASTD